MSFWIFTFDKLFVSLSAFFSFSVFFAIKSNYVIYYEICCRIYCFRMNGAIMIKQMLIAIVLMSLLIGHSLDAAASRRPLRSEKIVDFPPGETKVREKRFVNPLTSLFSVWNALTHIYSLYVEVSWITAHNIKHALPMAC